MSIYPEVLQQLISAFNSLPGIGKRSAERISLHLIDDQGRKAENLASLILDVKQKITNCPSCNNFSDSHACSVCSSNRRDRTKLCIVEYPKDVISLEKAGIFDGLYYVLLGSISPIDGRGPQSIEVSGLLKRLSSGQIKEVIIATDADQEGEATALFLKDILSEYDIEISRIGIGVPLGAEIEFADTATLAKSFAGRRKM